MVVTGTGQDTRFFEAKLRDIFEVGRNRTDPASDLREVVTASTAQFHGLAVFVGVKEKLALTDQICSTVDFMEKVKKPKNLLGCIGRTGLLAIAEGGIGNPHLFRDLHYGSFLF